jgi:hypothetical protein
MIYGPGADHWKTPAELFTAPRATNHKQHRRTTMNSKSTMTVTPHIPEEV